MPAGRPRDSGLTDRRKYAATFSRPQFSWITEQATERGLPFSEMLRRVIDVGRDTMVRQREADVPRT